MHKEACLIPSSEYAQVNLLQETTRLVPCVLGQELLSFSTSFGRVAVTNKIAPEDRAVWSTCLETFANDHRYYDLAHHSLGHQFAHHYLVLKDELGRTRAIQPFLMVHQDLTTGMPESVRRTMEAVRRKFPNFLKWPMLMVGCSAGEGHLVQDSLTGDSAWVARALRESLDKVARRMNALMIVFKDFPRSYRSYLDNLRQAGYTRVPSMPGAQLTLNFADFEEYLQTKLSHKTRKNLRKKFRTAASGPKMTMEVVNDITPFIDEVFPLYQQVLARSQFKFEELTPDYFCQLGKTMPDRARFFIWRQEGKAIAFASCLVHHGVMRDNYVGLDYTVALDYHLYFVTWRDLIVWAKENGCHTYYSAPLNYDPKYHFRLDLAPLDLYVRACWDWLNPIFRLLLPYLEPTRYDPMIKRFSNAHELW